MTRQFITKLTDGESVDEVYLASEKQLRPNRAGNLYLQVRCSDKTGSLTGMMWNADQKTYDGFDNGNYIRIRGTAQFYNGHMQLIVKSLQKVPGSAVDVEDFQAKSTADIDRLFHTLTNRLRAIRNYHLRNLAESFLLDDELMGKLKAAPAGVKNHHAYSGGLLEHIVSLTELALAVAPLYPELDADILVMGVFLHDLGKVEELTYSPDLGYSDAGQLLGHLVQGVVILTDKVRETTRMTSEPFPSDLELHLQHLVVSHHGEPEFGSPKVPMTYEALVLHHLDNLDAKMGSFRQLLAEDANSQSRWTSFNAPLGRKLWKAAATTPNE